MGVTGIVETKRINLATNYGLIDSPKSILPMKIWWLVPQYMMIGMCDVFGIMGMQELFYEHVAEEMRSIGAAMYIMLLPCSFKKKKLETKNIKEANL